MKLFGPLFNYTVVSKVGKEYVCLHGLCVADFDKKWNLHSHIHVISTITSLPIGS